MECRKRFTREEIEEALTGIRRARRKKTPSTREG
jgi:hypothetical protein